MPEEKNFLSAEQRNGFIEYLLQLERRTKVCFIFSVIWTFFAHGMTFFNKFCIHDDTYLFTVGSTVRHGRWFLAIIDKGLKLFWGGVHYSMPLFNGGISALCLAVSSCLIVSILDLKHTGIIISLSGILCTFPMLAGLFGYMFTAPYYTVAILMVSYACYLVCKKASIFSYICSVILLCCAVGIYQAFYPVATTLILIHLIIKTDKSSDNKWGDFIRSAIYYLSVLFFSIVAYFIATRISLKITNISLTDYLGISSMGQDGISVYIDRLFYAYRYFINPEKLSDGTLDSMFPLNILLFYRLGLFLMLLLCIFKVIKKFMNSKSGAIQLLLLLGCVPLSINFVFVMCAPRTVHSLMVYGQVFFFVFLAWLADSILCDRADVKPVLCFICSILLLLTSLSYARYDNIVYLKEDFAQQSAISYFTTLITQIKSTEGYKDDYPVIYLNAGAIADKSIQESSAWLAIRMLPVVGGVKEVINDYSWLKFINNWCAFRPVYEEASSVEDLPEVKAMPSYPDDGSIKVINEKVVVKF